MNKKGGRGRWTRGVRRMPGEDLAVDCREYHGCHMAAFSLWDGPWHVGQATLVSLLQEDFIFPLGTWDEK